jgi:GH18 family chitinase
VDGSYRHLRQLAGTTDRKYYKKAVTCSVWNNNNFWSYDCPQAMRKKMSYIRKRHLGGVMFWELSHDTPEGELLHILAGE